MVFQDKRCVFALVGIMSTIGFLFTLGIGSYFKYFANHFDEKYDFPIVSNVADIPTDWSTIPLVDILVTDEDECPSGSEPIFQKIWYGLYLACDCTLEDPDEGLIEGRACKTKGGETNCNTIEARPPVIQNVKFYE